MKGCYTDYTDVYTFLFIQEQYITIFLALNEIFKAPIKADSMAEFSSKANKARTNIPANQNPARKEFQVC